MRTLTLLMTLVFATAARAEIYEVPLPDLVGAYPAVHDVTFHLPGAPAVVRGASLRLVGSTEVGTATCFNGDVPWPTQTYTEMAGNDFTYTAESTNGNAPGGFETIIPFTAFVPAGHPAPTWDFLLDGEGSFTLFGNPAITACELTSNPPPTFTITGAWIRVDADIPTPASSTSWGHVKATYR
jgi:hypothetical protein